MFSLELFDSLNAAVSGGKVHELLSLNEELQKQGLVLTPEDAEEIIASRTRVLKNQGRVELDISVTKAIAKRLSESAYISPETYVKTINEIYEVFHFIKNATSDFTSDEDILDAIMFYYEKICGGSTELLMGKGIEKIVNNFLNRKNLSEQEQGEDDEYWNFDE